MTYFTLNQTGAKKLLSRYPRVKADWIENIKEADSGDIVDLVDAAGKFLGRGYFEKNSVYPVRVLTFQKDDINKVFFNGAIHKAASARKDFIDLSNTNAFRVVNEEGDYLPGLTVDVYGKFALIQYFSHGIEKYEDHIISAVSESFHPAGIYRLSRMTRSKIYPGEPIKTHPTELVWGQKAPEEFRVKENGINFIVSLENGAKTGLYIDMRDNRKKVQEYCRDADVLNTFSYTSSFSVYAALAGAKRTVNIDLSKKANEWGKKNFLANEIDLAAHSFLTEDVFLAIKRFARRKELFDVVIVDPPTFAKGKKKVFQTERDYTELCSSAMGLMRQTGILICALNSQDLSDKWFKDVISAAAASAGNRIDITESVGEGPDFTAVDPFPEGKTLKFAIVRINR